MNDRRHAAGVLRVSFVVILAVVAGSLGTAAATRQDQGRVAMRASEAGVVRTGTTVGRLPRQLVVRFTGQAVDRRRVYAASGVSVTRRIPGLRTVVVTVPPPEDPARVAALIAADRDVASVEPDWPRPLLDAAPSDPDFASQWALRNTGQPHPIADPPPDSVEGLSDADIDASDAWSLTTGDPGTVIAVIDSGIDASHPDLRGSLWANPGEIAEDGIDQDGNGYIDDVIGWDFDRNDNVPDDEIGHGTHVAGTIAAGIDDGAGGVGVCPDCSLMILKFGLDLASELEAIRYAIDNGADVINLSAGGPYFSSTEKAAYEAAQTAGILVVAAAGNNRANNDMAIADEHGHVLAPIYPASYDIPGLISVTASNDRDEYGYATGCYLSGLRFARCAFSSFGHDSVDLAAPGVDILSSVPGGGSDVWDGTSMAAPHVAGVAGLVRSAHPEYDVMQLRNAVLNGVDHPEGLAGGWTLTSGRLNAASALSAPTATHLGPSGGNISTAAPLSSGVRGRVRTPSNVNDVYKVRLRRGSRYAFQLDVPPGKDFDLYVWKPGTQEIFQVEYTCDWVGPCRWLARASTQGRGKDEVGVFRATRSGTYYLQVAAWFSSGRYSLSLGRV